MRFLPLYAAYAHHDVTGIAEMTVTIIAGKLWDNRRGECVSSTYVCLSTEPKGDNDGRETPNQNVN